MTWAGRPFHPGEPTLEEEGLDDLVAEAFPNSWWQERPPRRPLPLPLTEQRRKLMELQRAIWGEAA